MTLRSPASFAEALEVIQIGSITAQTVDEAIDTIRLLASLAATRLADLNLRPPDRVELRLEPSLTLTGSRVNGLTERMDPGGDSIRISLALTPGWALNDCIAAAHEFGHLILMRAPLVGSPDFAFMSGEYLAEREMWGLVKQISALGEMPSSLRSVIEGRRRIALVTAVDIWRKGQRALAIGLRGAEQKEAIRLFRDQILDLVSCTAYGLADAHELADDMALPSVARYARLLLSDLFAPLDAAGRQLPENATVADLQTFARALEVWESDAHALIDQLVLAVAVRTKA